MSPISFETFLISLNANSLVNPAIPKNEYVMLDLSLDNAKLKSVNISSADDLEQFVWNYMKKNNAKVAYGGYLERRGIYRRSDYFNQDDLESERNIHLGLDLWIEAGSPVFAPLDATIHSFKNNTNYGDYGPTIILEHRIGDYKFYTLYGHLSIASIEGLKIGNEVKQGAKIATLGTAEVNGDYPPHLHFQIIKDIQGFKGDYPGVSNQLDLEYYKGNCPDPSLLFLDL